ncbi:MAG: protein kinase family protein [Rickettsiales bacterium]|jgi:serine/threonine protein kinase|nr:protein kinase family protein [Rickettsiales bacterium]
MDENENENKKIKKIKKEKKEKKEKKKKEKENEKKEGFLKGLEKSGLFNGNTLSSEDISFEKISLEDNGDGTKEFKINGEKLETLGEGGFGQVFKVCGKNEEVYAVKTTSKSEAIDGECLFLKEFKADIKNKKLPKGLVAIHYANDENGTVVMDYHPGALPNKEKKGEYKEICRNPTKLKGLFEAVGYLHSRDLVHNDIKPANILVSKNDELVLCDYGVMKGCDKEGRIAGEEDSVVGSATFIPPECWGGIGGQDNRKHDVFSLGVALLETFVEKEMVDLLKEGDYLKDLGENQDLKEKICLAYTGKGKEIEEEIERQLDKVIPSIPKTIKDIIKGATKMDPAERSDIKGIVESLEKMEKALEKKNEIKSALEKNKSALEKSGLFGKEIITGEGPDGEITINGQEVKYLGKGAVGGVYKIADKNGKARAVKFTSSDGKEGGAEGECLFLKEFKDKKEPLPEGLTPIHYANNDDGIVVMDFCPGTFNIKNPEISKEICENPTKLMGIVKAIEYLHKNKLAHNDIKSGNILINENGVFVLCDYGIMEKFNNEDCERNIGENVISGTTCYISPDYYKVLSKNNNTDAVSFSKRDVFALGITLFETLTGEYLGEFFPVGNNFQMMSKYMNKWETIKEKIEEQLDGMTEVPETIKDIVKGAIKEDPKERYTTGTIIEKLEKMEEEKKKEKEVEGLEGAVINVNPSANNVDPLILDAGNIKPEGSPSPNFPTARQLSKTLSFLGSKTPPSTSTPDVEGDDKVQTLKEDWKFKLLHTSTPNAKGDNKTQTSKKGRKPNPLSK